MLNQIAAFTTCQQEQKGGPKVIPYKTANPFRESEEVFFFCDAPHLLKMLRNCFSNSFVHSLGVVVVVVKYAHLCGVHTCVHNVCREMAK